MLSSCAAISAKTGSANHVRLKTISSRRGIGWSGPQAILPASGQSKSSVNRRAHEAVHRSGSSRTCKELSASQEPAVIPLPEIKVKNPNYSQAVGRREWFDRLLTQR